MMNFLKRLFGNDARPTDDALHLYVRCNRCGSFLHVRVDPRHELIQDYDEDSTIGYRLAKEMMDSRCFQLMRAEIEFDTSRRELSRRIEGGTFVSKEEFEREQPKA